jgi:hypothetical protein
MFSSSKSLIMTNVGVRSENYFQKPCNVSSSDALVTPWGTQMW